jgi:membrane protein YdbS with pleckstrin-like domain
MERAFGLSRLVVYTAAGMSADGSIPGLDEAQADALRDTLVRRRGDDGV